MIVIIGASGLIGAQLFEDAAAAGESVIGTYAAHPKDGLVPFDARTDSLHKIAPELGPDDTVVLLSAYIDQNWIAENRDEAYALNVTAGKRLAGETFARGAKLVFLSTEAVFGGADTGHLEVDPVAPSTEYARKKVEMEEFLQASSGDWLIVRTGWTVGWRPDAPCPVANTYQALLGGEARMARDNIFTITDVRDVSASILGLIGSKAAGIYHAASNPPVSRVELAQLVMESSQKGSKMAYSAVNFDEIAFKEPRPRHAWLRNDKISAEIGQKFSPALATIKLKVAMIEAENRLPEG
jgi:dTDP-4-dehydrorhamnose reductase